MTTKLKLKGRGYCSYCEQDGVHIAHTIDSVRLGQKFDAAMCDVCFRLGVNDYHGAEPATERFISYAVRLIIEAVAK